MEVVYEGNLEGARYRFGIDADPETVRYIQTEDVRAYVEACIESLTGYLKSPDLLPEFRRILGRAAEDKIRLIERIGYQRPSKN